MAKENYLNDKKFLKALDLEPYKEQYIRITILDFTTERPLVSLEGKCTSGSVNINGSSNMRRTASCSVAVDFNGVTRFGYTTPEQYYNITEIENLISINKKIQLETGFVNTLQELAQWGEYKSYDIIWFPLGVYVIKSASVGKSNSGVNISLTLNDKIALLNGDMGGTIPAATNFSEEEQYSADGLTKETKKVLIKDIIRNLIVEFGGESPDNVIITDVPETAMKVMKWVGNNSVYYVDSGGNKYLTKDKDSGGTEYQYGKDIGYIIEPFTYPGTLECSAGETVVSVLDKIRNALGNYEFFYDLEGRFVFQEIKNFLNTNPTSTLMELDKSDYNMVANFSTSVYDFDQEAAALIMSISSSPQFPNIKNDFTIWGSAKTSSGAEKPIRYHLAFEDKPKPDTIGRFALVYTDYRKLQAVLPLDDSNFAEIDSMSELKDKKKYYYLESRVWHWDDEVGCFRQYSKDDYVVCWLKPSDSDWRTELYYQGLWSTDKTFANQPYSAELNSEWTKIVNVIGEDTGSTKKYSEDSNVSYPIYSGTFRSTDSSSYSYWLEFLSDSKFNIANIGRRTKVVSDSSVNCLYVEEIPKIIYLEADGNTTSERAIANKKAGYEVVQVSSSIYNDMVTGGGQNSAFGQIKELLYAYTSYNESISLTTVPIYYLEPNTRITICDSDIGVSGNYLIKSISLPLAPNGSSNISAAKIIEKSF